MVTKNERGREGHSSSALVWHCGDWGYLRYERAVSLCSAQTVTRIGLLEEIPQKWCSDSLPFLMVHLGVRALGSSDFPRSLCFM
jgi:hypothetical protein